MKMHSGTWLLNHTVSGGSHSDVRYKTVRALEAGDSFLCKAEWNEAIERYKHAIKLGGFAEEAAMALQEALYRRALATKDAAHHQEAHSTRLALIKAHPEYTWAIW